MLKRRDINQEREAVPRTGDDNIDRALSALSDRIDRGTERAGGAANEVEAQRQTPEGSLEVFQDERFDEYKLRISTNDGYAVSDPLVPGAFKLQDRLPTINPRIPIYEGIRMRVVPQATSTHSPIVTFRIEIESVQRGWQVLWRVMIDGAEVTHDEGNLTTQDGIYQETDTYGGSLILQVDKKDQDTPGKNKTIQIWARNFTGREAAPVTYAIATGDWASILSVNLEYSRSEERIYVRNLTVDDDTDTVRADLYVGDEYTSSVANINPVATNDYFDISSYAGYDFAVKFTPYDVSATAGQEQWVALHLDRRRGQAYAGFGLVDEWFLHRLDVEYKPGLAAKYVANGKRGNTITLQLGTGNAFTVGDNGTVQTSFGGSPPGMLLTYDSVNVFDSPWAMLFLVKSGNVVDPKTIFELQYGSDYVKGSFVTTGDIQMESSISLNVVTATVDTNASNDFWVYAFFSFDPTNGNMQVGSLITNTSKMKFATADNGNPVSAASSLQLWPDADVALTYYQIQIWGQTLSTGEVDEIVYASSLDAITMGLDVEAVPARMIKGGELQVGSGTVGTDFTGIRIWQTDYETWKLAGINNEVEQVYINTDGKLYAGAGAFRADVDGPAIVHDGTFGISQRLSFEDNLGVESAYMGFDDINQILALSVVETGADLFLQSGADIFISSQGTATDINLSPGSTGNVVLDGTDWPNTAVPNPGTKVLQWINGVPGFIDTPSGGSMTSFDWGDGVLGTTITDGEAIDVTGIGGVDTSLSGNQVLVSLDLDGLTAGSIAATDSVAFATLGGLSRKVVFEQMLNFVSTVAPAADDLVAIRDVSPVTNQLKLVAIRDLFDGLATAAMGIADEVIFLDGDGFLKRSSSNPWGVGNMETWTLAGDTGSSPIVDSDTATIAGGSAITTSAATDTVTVNLDINSLTLSSSPGETDEVVFQVTAGGSVLKTTVERLFNGITTLTPAADDLVFFRDISPVIDETKGVALQQMFDNLSSAAYGGTGDELIFRDATDSLLKRASGLVMQSFTLAADTGSNSTISQGNTMTLTGGAAIATVGGGLDALTIDIDIGGLGTTDVPGATDYLLAENASTGIPYKVVTQTLFNNIGTVTPGATDLVLIRDVSATPDELKTVAIRDLGDGLAQQASPADNMEVIIRNDVTGILERAPLGNSAGDIPLSNNTVCTNLDADKVDGIHATSFLRSDAADTASSEINFTAPIKLTEYSTGNPPADPSTPAANTAVLYLVYNTSDLLQKLKIKFDDGTVKIIAQNN